MRKTYIDNIKWITVLLVVIYHVIYMYNGVCTAGIIGPFKENQPQDIFQYIVYPWFMVLLFVVSGMSSRYYLNSHTTKEYIGKWTTKFLVPSTIGLVVFGWVLGYYNMSIAGALENLGMVPKPILLLIMMVSGSGPLWYIQLVWLFAVVLVIFRKIEKDRLAKVCKNVPVIVLVGMAFLSWGAAQILNTPLVVVYRFGIYGFAFFMGYLFFGHDSVMDRLEKWWHVLSLLAIILCVIFAKMFWGQPYAEHSVLDTFTCNMYAWIATIAILSFMKKWGNFENSFSKFMAKESWGLYLFHYLPIAVFAYYLNNANLNMPAICYYLIDGLAAFVGAYILYHVFSKIPFIRWAVCGIGGKK